MNDGFFRYKLVKSVVLILTQYFFVPTVSSAQTQMSDINESHVNYRKDIELLNKVGINCFSEIQSSVNDSSDLGAFYFHTATYTINAPIEQVWNTCIFGSPTNLWKGKTLNLSAIYCNNSNLLYYDEQQPDSLELNQVYFVNIRIMRRFKITATLKTTNIDHAEKLIEFTYIEGNKSNGKQILRLVAISDNETKLIHDTFYKSDSKFRDKRLYPPFHQKAITDLHKKIDLHSQKNTITLKLPSTVYNPTC
jgi:hypothetical protein